MVAHLVFIFSARCLHWKWHTFLLKIFTFIDSNRHELNTDEEKHIKWIMNQLKWKFFFYVQHKVKPYFSSSWSFIVKGFYFKSFLSKTIHRSIFILSNKSLRWQITFANFQFYHLSYWHRMIDDRMCTMCAFIIWYLYFDLTWCLNSIHFISHLMHVLVV